MARLESGNLNLKLGWHSMTDLVRSSVEKLQGEIKLHKIINKVKDDFVFKFDFALLEQALINILHNSLSHTSSESEIVIEGMQQSYNYILSISDNGNGFNEEALIKLFDKFYRIPGTKTGGTGLGLSIAKGFIEAHGGTITAANKKNGGAVFTIILPIKEK